MCRILLLNYKVVAENPRPCYQYWVCSPCSESVIAPPCTKTDTRLLHTSLVPNGISTPAFLLPLFLTFSCPSTHKGSSQNQGTAQMPEGKWHQTAQGVNTSQERVTTSRSWSCLWSVLHPWPGLVCTEQIHASPQADD